MSYGLNSTAVSSFDSCLLRHLHLSTPLRPLLVARVTSKVLFWCPVRPHYPFSC